MLVVPDASPLNIPIRLGHIQVLSSLFQTVVIPDSVAREMSRPAAPPVVRQWIANPPPWLSIQTPATIKPLPASRHRGETDAIQLATELHADAILLDEDKPRTIATRLGLRVVGTVGILEQAANMGHIRDLKAIHDQLRSTDFYVSDKILANSLARHLAHKQSRN